MIGTNELKGFNICQLRAMYAEARGLCVGAGKFKSAKQFDAHVAHFIDREARGELGRARSYVQSAFSQIGVVFNVNTSTPPSEETLSWGGFLGGEISWDETRSREIVREIMTGVK